MSSVNSFGRIAAPQDARDLRFLMRAAIPQIQAVIGKPKPRVRPYKDGPLLDQGPTPQCVGYSTRGFLDAAPMMTKPTDPPTATQIYKAAQERDEWPGSNYDGTSVRGAMKALTDYALIKSYVWGQTVDDMVNWIIGGYGTCLVGSNWYAEMSEVDHAGFLREPAPAFTTPIGGHAWRVTWYDKTLKCFVMRNSWGKEFGWLLRDGTLSGYARVRPDFMARLLREDGEVSAPTQVKVSAVLP